MKVGDIVYFKSTYTVTYGKVGGSYEYLFKPGDRYRIDDIRNLSLDESVKTDNITNLEDGTNHFAHSEIFSRLITKEEWRELQLNKLIC